MGKLDLENLRKTLQDAVDKKNADKAKEDQIRQQKNQEDRNTMLESMSKDFGSVFKPYLDEIQKHSQLSSEELSRIIAESVHVNVPEVNTDKLSTAIEQAITNSMAAVRFPTPNHTFNVPPIAIPPIRMPEQMDIKGWIGIMGYDKGLLQNPLPVQLRDAKGNPVSLGQQAIQMLGGGGGKMDFFTINGITNTVGVVQINPDGTPFYSGSSTGAASSSVSLVNADGAYYNSDNPLPVTFAAASVQPVSQVSGNIWSVFVTNPTGDGDRATALRVLLAGDSVSSVIINDALVSFGVNQVSGSVFSVNNVGPVAQGDAAVALRVVIAGNSDASVYVNNPVAQGDAATALRVVIAGNSDASVAATQVGTWNVATVTSITNSVAASLVDSSGVQYSGSNPLPVVFGATATQGVNVVDSSGVAYSGTNPVPTAVTGITNSVAVVALDRDGNPLTTGPIGNGDQATALRVVQAGDAVASVYVNNPVAQGDAATALRVIIAGNSDASVSATQVGTWNVATVTSITNSVAASIVDSSGVGYSGSNPVPVTLISGALTSTISVGDSAARAADNGGNPVKVGGIARQTNPTAYADGDRTNIGTDDLGRQITRPIQVRDLTKTAYVSVANGTETTLLAGVAGAFLDCVAIMGSNNSDAAISVDIRAVTAGNIVHTIRIPANATAGWTPPIPWPQDATGNNWTVDLPDVTGSTLTFSALFSQEV
jgi:hypothetical protein